MKEKLKFYHFINLNRGKGEIVYAGYSLDDSSFFPIYRKYRQEYYKDLNIRILNYCI